MALALGVPLGAIVYWLLQRRRSHAARPPRSARAAWHTALYSAAAGLLATAAALPVALLSVRHPGRPAMVLERSTYLVLAMPGLVIALGLTYFSERYAAGFLYQSAAAADRRLRVMFFPLALVAVRASVARAPVGSRRSAAPSGAARCAVLWRVTLPARRPGPGGRLLPRVPRGGDRADRDPGADPDRRPDPRHPVLGLPDQPLLRRRRPPTPRVMVAGGRRPELRPRPLVRPAARRARRWRA